MATCFSKLSFLFLNRLEIFDVVLYLNGMVDVATLFEWYKFRSSIQIRIPKYNFRRIGSKCNQQQFDSDATDLLHKIGSPAIHPS